MIPTLPFIQDAFDRFNALCFEGMLPPIPIVLTRAGTFLGKVEYKGVRSLFGLISSNSDFKMKISTSFDLPEEELEDVVLHEMIHYYIAWKNIKDSSVHGKVFRNIMEQINSGYGRNITISHKRSRIEPSYSRGRNTGCRICVSTFRDGSRYVTVASKAKAPDLQRLFLRCPDIIRTEWFASNDPFFDRYPRSRTAKVYRISPEDLNEHLKDAVRIPDTKGL